MSPLPDSVRLKEEGAYADVKLTHSSRDSSSEQQPLLDPDLQRLIDTWPTLPPAAKAAVLATLKAVKP